MIHCVSGQGSTCLHAEIGCVHGFGTALIEVKGPFLGHFTSPQAKPLISPQPITCH